MHANIPDDWWPELLREIPKEDPWKSEDVVVAEIGQPWGLRSYRRLYTALVPPDKAPAVLARPGGIGHEVEATGPHPTGIRYQPKFWIGGGDVIPDGLEPLIVACFAPRPLPAFPVFWFWFKRISELF